MPLVPAGQTREWMNDTPERFAYRCLPLLIANQAGWLIKNPHPIRVTWDGGVGTEGLKIEALGDALPSVRTHFGSGILTWNLPYLFRTSPGHNLLVRGPANWPKDGIYPLEGIVETDWAPATFTMNWKLTRANWPVVFEADEPICMIVPQRRRELEDVVPSVRQLLRAPAVAQAFHRWSHDRARFLHDLARPGSSAQKEGWQRDYMVGILPDGTPAADHQTRLHLRPFSPGETPPDELAHA